jgi:hypothetical protein
MPTHYPKKRSLRKRVRKLGRKTLSRKRRVGRSLKVRRVF